MSYLVLARKYRPQSFDELIGQEHISHILQKAITSKRIAHAYLFCGPRGVGKTSCARILAKSLNCEKGPAVKSCGKCSSCREITNGNSFDVLEIDGASNRGIDEIRTLRENVKFAPSYGHYKIYIVDEVHMLTTEAFNALLKTLEEPPEHVKFIFATTAPNKIPSTIISRCQRFDFKRIPVKVITGALEAIAKKEKLKIDQDALFAVSKAAQGSLRDALSILDQLSALNERNIKAEDVFSMLGVVETQLLFDMSEAISQKNCLNALNILETIIDKGKDTKQLMRDLIEHFRNLMIIKVGGKSLGRLVDYPVAIKEMLLSQCQHFSLKDILAAIDTLLEAQENSRISEFTRMPFEIAIAKLTYQSETGGSANSTRPSFPEKEPAAAEKPESDKKAAVTTLRSNKGHVHIAKNKLSDNSDDVNESIGESKVLEEGVDLEMNSSNVDIENIRRLWDTLTYAVSRKKMSIATYLQEGVPFEFRDSLLTIGFSKENGFHMENLENSANKTIVEEIFSEKLKRPVHIKYEITEGYKPQEEDEPLVKKAIDTFKGKVVNKWHND